MSDPFESQVLDLFPTGVIPSWLSHCVRLYQGTRERISIAINLMAPVPPQKSETRPLRSQSP